MNRLKLLSSGKTLCLMSVLLFASGCHEEIFTRLTPPGDVSPQSPASVVSSLQQKENAVIATAANSPFCTSLGDFYWEFGDSSGVLSRGTIGTKYNQDYDMPVASASKWVFAAQVIEMNNGVGSFGPFLQMLSGYIGMDNAICSQSTTVSDCLKATSTPKNYVYSNAKKGLFVYNGAHDEYLAYSQFGWGSFTKSDLTNNMDSILNNQVDGYYDSPGLAGGMRFTPANYGSFLRKVMNGDLLLHDYLGADPVCTTCSTNTVPALQPVSPVPLDWHYSYNHWIEDDSTGDGAFSSPGAYGFYPWISKDKSTYGILARVDLVNAGSNVPAITPYYHSIQCGKLLRAAWFSGVAQ